MHPQFSCVPSLLRALLSHHDGLVRHHAAQALGITATATDAHACAVLLTGLLEAATHADASRAKATELEAREGALHALAYVAAHAAQGVYR